MPKLKKIRTLESIAVKIRDLAVARAPIDTGNLRNRIKAANTPVKDKMIKILDDNSISLELSYAPDGATYGQYWNRPYGEGNGTTATIKKRYPLHFDYAYNALEDPTLSQAFQNYVNELGDFVVKELEMNLDILD